MKKEGLQLLQNIQDQIQCKKMKSYGYNLSKITVEPVGNDNSISRFDEEDDDVHPNDLSRLIEAQGIANELQNIEADSIINGRTFKLLSERSKVSNSKLVKANVLKNSIINNNNDENHLRGDEDNMNDHQYLNGCEKKVHFGLLIEFVTGSLLRYVKEENQYLDASETTLIEDKGDSIISMDRFAKINGLDDKQSMAFKIVCSTFILDCIERNIYNCQGGNTRNSGIRDTVLNVLNDITKKTLKLLVEDLKRCGGKGNLIMFLSGKGGSGKSYTVFTIEKYCCYFCKYVSIPFEKNTILLTAMTGCAVALIKDVTLQTATGIENKQYKINDDKRSDWKGVRMMMIDEISFCKQATLEVLDQQLRHLKSEPKKVYGGVHIICIGDFHQLVPGLNMKDAIYSSFVSIGISLSTLLFF